MRGSVTQLCCAVAWSVRLCRGVCSAATQEGGEVVCVRVYCNGTLEYMTMHGRLYGCYIMLYVCRLFTDRVDLWHCTCIYVEKEC